MAADGESSYLRFLKGDASALEELVRAYGDALIRFAYSFLHDEALCEDVMEDAFATLLYKRREFPAERSFKAFLFRVVRNKCLDHLRFRKKVSPLRADLVEALLSDAEEEAMLSERDRQLYLCMQRLPTLYASVLQLVYLEGFHVREAGAILHKSPKQTYNLLQRAKSKLREILEKEGFCDE